MNVCATEGLPGGEGYDKKRAGLDPFKRKRVLHDNLSNKQYVDVCGSLVPSTLKTALPNASVGNAEIAGRRVRNACDAADPPNANSKPKCATFIYV